MLVNFLLDNHTVPLLIVYIFPSNIVLLKALQASLKNEATIYVASLSNRFSVITRPEDFYEVKSRTRLLVTRTLITQSKLN
jgi:hypothetical protein